MAGLLRTARISDSNLVLAGLLRVNLGLHRRPCHRSAQRGKADENDAKADVTVRMSVVGGKADVSCQGLSGPFIANNGLSRHHSSRNEAIAMSGARAIHRISSGLHTGIASRRLRLWSDARTRLLGGSCRRDAM